MSSRDLFAELSSALVEAKAHLEGKMMLKIHHVDEVGELNEFVVETSSTQCRSEHKIEGPVSMESKY